MLLAFDIGNSNVKVGAFQGDRLAARWRVATDRGHTSDEYAVLISALLAQRDWSFGDFEACIFCSTVPPLGMVFEDLVREHLGREAMVVNHRMKTGLRILYDRPQELGTDRLAEAVAAYHLFGGPVIVIDMGTVITFNVVSAEGAFEGGAIVPGIGISLDALFEHTSALPRVELVLPPRAVGTNTVQSMQSGVLHGYIGLVEGLIQRFREELGDQARVVATGGFSPRLAPHIPAIDLVHGELTLEGLRILYQLNPKATAG